MNPELVIPVLTRATWWASGQVPGSTLGQTEDLHVV